MKERGWSWWCRRKFCRRYPGQAAEIEWSIGPVTPNAIGGSDVVFILTNEQKVPLAVAFKTAAGHQAVVDGVPVWSTDGDAIALDVAADGLSAVARAVADGDAVVTVAADADLGAGVQSITGSLAIRVVEPSAAVVEITPGAPEIQ